MHKQYSMCNVSSNKLSVRNQQWTMKIMYSDPGLSLKTKLLIKFLILFSQLWRRAVWLNHTEELISAWYVYHNHSARFGKWRFKVKLLTYCEWSYEEERRWEIIEKKKKRRKKKYREEKEEKERRYERKGEQLRVYRGKSTHIHCTCWSLCLFLQEFSLSSTCNTEFESWVWSLLTYDKWVYMS